MDRRIKHEILGNKGSKPVWAEEINKQKKNEVYKTKRGMKKNFIK